NDLTIPLDAFLPLRRLLIEGLRRRCRLPLREEPLLLSAAHHRGGARRAIRRRKGFPGWNDGQISGHHGPVTKSLAAHRYRRRASGAEVICRKRRDRLADPHVAGG